MDVREFVLGAAEESGRETVLCIQGNRLQAVKWSQCKAHLFHQGEFASAWTPYNMPHLAGARRLAPSAFLSTGEDRATAAVDWAWAGLGHKQATRIRSTPASRVTGEGCLRNVNAWLLVARGGRRLIGA
jgi:hypothetical protein